MISFQSSVLGSAAYKSYSSPQTTTVSQPASGRQQNLPEFGPDLLTLSDEAQAALAEKQAAFVEKQAENRHANIVGIFSNAESLASSLGKLLGLGGTFTDIDSLLVSLQSQISEESDSLTKTLGNLINEAGLGDVTKKITFAEDADGNIVIEGNISAKQKRQLAKLVNDSPELVERIKTQKARMEVAEALTGRRDFSQNLHRREIEDATRTQLLKDYLNKNGYSLDDLQNDESLQILLTSFPELDEEVQAYLERKDAPSSATVAAPAAIELGETDKVESTAVRSLLSMKRGELSQATDNVPDFDQAIGKLRSDIHKAIVEEYNKMYLGDGDSQIASFTMKIDDRGRLSITEVKTNGDDAEANARALQTMNTWLSDCLREQAKELGTAILEDHDGGHGDVKEFKHEIISKGGFEAAYTIESPDADRAAMQEMMELTQDIGTALGDFFGKTMGIKNPFEIIFGSDGQLSFDAGLLSSTESQTVRQLLADVNRFLSAEAAGEDTENMLSGKLADIGEKFLALKDVQDKFHDKSLVPQEFRFALQ